jgi:hypothetical protein
MKVKAILGPIHDEDPAMSRAEVKRLLGEIKIKSDELSRTENKILRKYQDEFYDEDADSTNTFVLLSGDSNLSRNSSDLLSDKIKYAYAFRHSAANGYLNVLGRFVHGQNFSPSINNTELFDIGFRFRGSILQKLGYSLTIIKGGIKGSGGFASTIDPRMNYNFHYVENIENIGNYDFTEGYLRYYTDLAKDMNLSVEIGREKMKFGYGYGNKLVLSGNHPYLDFFKVDFTYGVFSFTSWHASTVGEYDIIRSNNYTKYIATNHFKLSFPNVLDAAIGETVIYSGRGLDLAYTNPFAFYKFDEMSLQDRDNGSLWFEMQTHFLKNIELQGTLFLDDNPLGNLSDLSNYINKTGYQLGLFWYSPLNISDLSLVFEYTRIRPYVYSHINAKNTYTSWGQVLGDNIGPNSDEMYTKVAYNFNEKIRFNFEFQHIRHGANMYDSQGNLVFNAGGDPLVNHRDNIDPVQIVFLDGERINTNIFTFDLRFEPLRQFFFDVVFRQIVQKNVTREISNNSSYGYIKLQFEI